MNLKQDENSVSMCRDINDMQMWRNSKNAKIFSKNYFIWLLV